MPSRSSILFQYSLALAYSVFLFYIASYLQVWTKKAAAALTWVVYAQIVKSMVLYLVTLFFFTVFIKWPDMRRKWLFLALGVLYSAFSAFFIYRLEDSVNEYVHFPQYATLVLLWYTAFKKAVPRALAKPGRPWIPALAVSAVLGVLEECYQIILPARVFDLQDIWLNFMGVWLGGLLIWVLEDRGEAAASLTLQDS